MNLSRPPVGRTGREGLIVVFFLVTAILHTWPIASDPARLLTRNPEAVVHVWALDEMSRQLVTAPWALFEARTFHPYSHTLATVDHVFANALLAAPLRLFITDSVLLYNVVLLATFTLTGYFTFLLVRALSGSAAAGLLSGCAFAYATVRWHQLPHLHILSAQWVPLALLTLHRALAVPSVARGLALTAAAVLVALSSWHIALLGAVAIGVVALWTLLSMRSGRRLRIGVLLAAAVVVLLATAPFALVYARLADEWRPVQTGTASERTHELSSLSLKVEGLAGVPGSGKAPYAATLSRFVDGESVAFPGLVTLGLSVVPLIALRGGSGGGRVARVASMIAVVLLAVLAVAVVEGLAGAGAVAALVSPAAAVLWLSTALLVAGIARARGSWRNAGTVSAGVTRQSVGAYTAVAVTGVIFALGPQVEALGVSLGPGVYREDWLPVLSLIRAPARFVLLLALGLAVLAGFGVKVLLDRLSSRSGAVFVVVVVALLNLELRQAPLDVRYAPRPRRADLWLARLAEPGAVLEYPVRRSLWAVYAGLQHGRELINGVGYLQPPAFKALEGDDELSPRQLEILWEHLHPRFILVYGEQYEGDSYARILAATEQPDVLRLRSEFGRTRVMELVDRGAGPTLLRRWPRRHLLDSRIVAFGAAVGEGLSTTTSTLTVALNGHVLLQAEGPEATAARAYELPIPHHALVDGINTFEITGDYRYPPGVTAGFIGTTGISVPADLAVESAPDGTYLQINGRQIAADKGYTLIVIDPATGAIQRQGSFNTSWFSDASAQLARFVEELPGGAVVLVATEFDASRQLTAEGVAALRQLGLEADLRERFGVQHAAIGVKGRARGTALEAAGDGRQRVQVGTPGERRVQLNGFAVR